MKTSKKVDTNPRLSVRDPDRSLRQTFGVIGKRIAVGGDMAAGVRYAASYTEGATRQERAPKDWNEIGLSTLRTLAVYGYDHFTRAEALRRIEEIVTLKSETPITPELIEGAGYERDSFDKFGVYSYRKGIVFVDMICGSWRPRIRDGSVAGAKSTMEDLALLERMFTE